MGTRDGGLASARAAGRPRAYGPLFRRDRSGAQVPLRPGRAASNPSPDPAAPGSPAALSRLGSRPGLLPTHHLRRGCRRDAGKRADGRRVCGATSSRKQNLESERAQSRRGAASLPRGGRAPRVKMRTRTSRTARRCYATGRPGYAPAGGRRESGLRGRRSPAGGGRASPLRQPQSLGGRVGPSSSAGPRGGQWADTCRPGVGKGRLMWRNAAFPVGAWPIYAPPTAPPLPIYRNSHLARCVRFRGRGLVQAGRGAPRV